MKVSIQGYKGSFHHLVVDSLDLDAQLLTRSSFAEVFADVSSMKADMGVVAIENSIAGAILENYDRLKNSALQVVGEYYLRIGMQLIAPAGTELHQIDEVYSHPMALKQCQDFLLAHPKMQQIKHVDTALAVKEVLTKAKAESKSRNEAKVSAAIAGKLAAQIYGGEIIAESIETDPQNYTRFLLLARHDNVKSPQLEYPQTGSTKSTLYLETNHKPGSLMRVLQVFEEMNLNMTMLVSRPIVGEAWSYGFYIDFVAKENLDTDQLKQQLAQVTSKLLIFGSYPEFNR